VNGQRRRSGSSATLPSSALPADSRQAGRESGRAHSLWALPELVETAVRTGNRGPADDALSRLAESARTGGTAVQMLEEIGMDAFTQRGRRELRAAGGTTGKHAAPTTAELTAQETRSPGCSASARTAHSRGLACIVFGAGQVGNPLAAYLAGQGIKEQIQKARSHPWISPEVPGRGFVYDVRTGRLSEVFPDGQTVTGQ
jgi:hypothetical protein